MLLAAPRDHGDDSLHTQLGCFLQSPFHAVKLEDGECKSDLRGKRDENRFAEFEFDAIRLDASDAAATDLGAGGNVKLLANLGAEYAGEMIGVGADKGSAVSGGSAAGVGGQVYKNLINMNYYAHQRTGPSSTDEGSTPGQ